VEQLPQFLRGGLPAAVVGGHLHHGREIGAERSRQVQPWCACSRCAMPPLPDWLLTRMTASYVRPTSAGSIGRYGTDHGARPAGTPSRSASRAWWARPLLIASWWVPEKAV
jgi:hypothetical protein